VPGWQLAQTRSADDVPAAETYVPGSQVVHVEHRAAFVAVLNSPLGQVSQPRSLVLEGAVFTNCPAVQE
jgi:hypothetical protein